MLKHEITTEFDLNNNSNNHCLIPHSTAVNYN